MEIIYGLPDNALPIKGSIVAVGVFDGVHVGHAVIMRNIVRRARALRMKSVVVTFDPHPANVLVGNKKIPSLISLHHRIELIQRFGVDYLVVLKFTRMLSKLSAEDFIKNILINKLKMKEMCVSTNFMFGKNASAGIDELRYIADYIGFSAIILNPKKIQGRIVSSSLIRKYILSGQLSLASKFLGRPVSILGTVIHGLKRGRILGFPTANINPHHETIPPGGVYAVKVVLGRKTYDGVLNIGRRPTFEMDGPPPEPGVEVHIFNFSKNIYGKDIEVIFKKKIRPERRFKDSLSLIEQINKDIQIARKY